MNPITKLIAAIAPRRRALSMDTVLDAVWWYGPEMRLVDIFVGEDGLFALYIEGSTLYRAEIIIDQDAQTATVGEPEELEFNLRGQTGVTVLRQRDGTYRLFMRACVAVLNRVGEIDSTQLFDNMISRAQASGIYPVIDFFHLGEQLDIFDFGQCDFLARDGLVYLASGTLDPDHPLTEPFVRSVQENPGYWGNSIEFLPLQRDALPIPTTDGEDITLRVFTDGFNTRITVLPEADAASLFTTVLTQERSKTMKQRTLTEGQLSALRALFADDEDAYNAFLASNEDINRAAEGMISRESNGAPAGETVSAEADDEDEDGVDAADIEIDEDAADIEIDEETLNAIVSAVAERLGTAETRSTMTAIAVQLESITGQLGGIAERFDGMDERLQSVEATDEEKHRAWSADRAPKAARKVTFRPREQRAAADGEQVERTMADEAADTIAALNLPY